MKLFLDESVPKVINEFLNNVGASVVAVFEFGLSGSDDEIVFEKAQKQGRIFVTVDLKFVTRIFLSKSQHSGVILLRYKGKIPQELLKVLSKFIKSYEKKDLKNTLVVIDKEKFRIRRV